MGCCSPAPPLTRVPWSIREPAPKIPRYMDFHARCLNLVDLFRRRARSMASVRACVRYAACVPDAPDATTGTCRAYALARAAGDACGLVGTEFVECSMAGGLACDEGTKKCVAMPTVGLDEPCTDAVCDAGLKCDPYYDVCIEPLADGAPCERRTQCASGFCFGPEGSSVCGDAESVDEACAP